MTNRQEQPDDSVGLPRIRAFLESDRVRLINLWRTCNLTRWYNDPDEDIDRYVRAAEADILVCAAGGRIIGSVCVGSDGHRGWMYYLAVDPDYRDRGLGRRLVTSAEDWLRGRSVSKMHAMVRDTNRKVTGFYEALGYAVGPVKVMQRWLKPLPPAPPGERPPPGAPGAPLLRAIQDDALDVTVTFLDMERPPERARAPRPAGNLAVLRADKPPVTFYRFLYRTIGEPWLWWERRDLTDAALARIIHDPRVEIYVLYVDGAPGGFAEIDRRDHKATDLAYFGLTPDQIGKQLGPFLLDWAIDAAWQGGARRLRVNTCTLDHPKALGLYQRAGFRPYRRQSIRMNDPRKTEGWT